MSEFYCPDCGAVLSAPNLPCPFCAEAQRVLRQLLEKDDVRLCARCGALLEDAQADLCPTCRKAAAAPPSFWRRDDRIAGWIRERFVAPAAEREGLVCPSCQSPVSPLAIFCAQCGYKLAGAPATTASSRPSATGAPGAGESAAGEASPGSGATAGPAGPEAVGPSRRPQTSGFEHDQAHPRGPDSAPPVAPWYEQAWRWLRAFFGPPSRTEGRETWLWIVVGILLVGIAAMAVFWATLLRSGDLVFR